MSNCEKCDDTGWYTITAAEFQREHDVITDLSPDQMMSFPCDLHDTQMTHPEETCQRCGRPNIWSWSVDSDRFNVAVQALGLTVAAIICPVCFVEGHQKATGLRCTWRLIPADGGFHFPPDEITHQTPPDGSGIMPCCGRTPFEVALSERMTTDIDLVTCSPRDPHT